LTSPAHALSAIPESLRTPLIDEYRLIVQNYLERRWSPAELSGGRFCEIVFTILDGHAKKAYASAPSKPSDFVSACRKLESNKGEPRSFQILIPRALPVLYEVRNNRNVGHVGGDVDPNHMDATLVVSMCNWVMGELVRVLHNLPIEHAQALVDSLAERRIPLVWKGDNTKRVLAPNLGLKEQVLLLLASEPASVAVDDLLKWLRYGNRTYLMKTLREMEDRRLIILHARDAGVEILPPGAKLAEELVQRYAALGATRPDIAAGLP
jgi:hypothetical protein